MDAFDDGDQSDSQATQMLQELLEHDTDSSRLPSGSRASGLNPQNVHQNEISSDSLPSSRTSNSLPQYHFHGLASTQTQSQMNEEEVGEGSPKRSIRGAPLAKDIGRSHSSPTSRSASLNASSSRNAQLRVEQVNVHASSLRDTRKKTAATVTFQSPRSKTGMGGSSKPVAQDTPYKPTAPSSRYKATPRPLSRASSQDSFASEDPEEQFLTKSKKFELPLSQLATEPPSGSRPSDVVVGTSNSLSSMYASSPSTRRMRPPPSPPRGRILVEATPSQSSKSSSSQSQDEGQARPQQFEATQVFDENQQVQQRSMNVDEDDGYESSEPSSSYGRFLNGERDPEPELEATQPSTQLQDSHMFDADDSPIEQRNGHPSGNTGTSTNAQSSGPRSLLKMVKPENQWRYKKYQQQDSVQRLPPTNPSHMSSLHPGGSSTPAVPLPSAGQETQISHEEGPANGSTYPLGFNHSSRNSSNASPLACLATTRIPSPAIDSMDVIPDSEPLRSEEPNPKRRLLSPLPARSRAKPNSRASIDIDYEMAPPLAHLQDGHGSGDPAHEYTEEEDVPLAAAVLKKQTMKKPGKTTLQKGKGKLEQVNEADETVAAGRFQKGDNVEKRSKAAELDMPSATSKLYPRSGPPPKMGQSWETGVVPSSVPDQDIVKPTRKSQSRTTEQSSKAPKSSRRDPRKASTTGKRCVQEAKSEPEESGSEDELLSSNQKQATEGTVDEEYEDKGEAGPSRKRKRASSNKAVTSQSKKSKAPVKRLKRTQTAPGKAQQKQLRSAISTNRRQASREGTRVFALWRQDCHFYSGTIHSLISNGRYEVHFDDETVQDVPIDQMYRAELRVGDSVIVAGTTVTSHVIGFVDGEPDRVRVKHTTKNDTKELDLELSEIRIAFKTIKKDWLDRLLSTNSVVTSVKPVTKAKLSPSPSKQSVLSTPFGGDLQQTMLEGMGLIVTLNAVNGNWSEEKGNLRKTIQSNGGIVIDDLSTILQMDGKHTKNNHCWTIRKGDVRWIGKDEIEKVLLIADDPTQKPKYLIALALGIPCISVEWLHDCVQRGEYKDWDSHLLPQGLSTPLGARLSQQVDLDWGNSVHHLRDIMSNVAAAKLFAGKSILCVGPDMVPQPKGKKRPGVDEKAQDAINAVARIILSMGADRVEAVTDVKYATEDPSEYDLVVIREPEQYSPDVADGNTVHWTWVKECLIASRYLPYPDWPVACHSQEA